MKALKYAIAGLLVLGMGAFALSACGPTSSCESDTDCSGDEVCAQEGPQAGQCLVNCTSDDAACTDTQTCQKVASGKKGCFDQTGGADTDDMTDAGMDGGNGDGGMGTEKNHYFVQIKDVTREKNTMDRDGDGTQDGQQSCADDVGSTEGGDIFGVELLNENNETVAWGTNVVSNRVGNASEGDFDSILNGMEPQLTAAHEGGEQCPGETSPTFSGNVVSMGCGGSAVVGFKDADGNYMPIKSGYKILAYEYGVACFESCDTSNVKSCQVEYTQVNICDKAESATAQEGDLVGASAPSAGADFEGCSTNLGSAKGIVTRVEL